MLRANKRRWPPVLIQVGDTECLLGDSERMAESIRAAGGQCELQVWPGQVHVFPAFYPVIPKGERRSGTWVSSCAPPALSRQPARTVCPVTGSRHLTRGGDRANSGTFRNAADRDTYATGRDCCG